MTRLIRRKVLLAVLIVIGSGIAADARDAPPPPSVFVYDCDSLATITGRRDGDQLELLGIGQAPLILRRTGEDPATFAAATVTVTMNDAYLRITGSLGDTVCRRNVDEASHPEPLSQWPRDARRRAWRSGR